MTIVATVLLVVASLFTIDLEPGATFDGGICWEADGTEGIAMYDGQCMTPADYDAIYSFENLSNVPSISDPSVSIAEHYEMTPDVVTPSDRPLGEGLVAEPFTFTEYVQAAHLPIAV